jgi:hypothetical protein
MANHEQDIRMPTHDRPLNGPRRKTLGPLVATLLILCLIAVVFLLIASTTG